MFLAAFAAGGSPDVIDDTGFKHVRVKVVAPGMKESVALLDRMYENPNVSTTLMEAGIVGGRPFFELDLFGASSQVDEVLGPGSKKAATAPKASPEFLEAHV
jgi:hypothetical protein